MSSQDEDQQGLVLSLVFGLVALLIALVMGVGIYHRNHAAGTTQAQAKPAANTALADVIKGAQAGRKLVISGFHDATGNASQNAELAKKRAVAVRDALKSAGVADEKIELKKPEALKVSGSNAPR